MPKHVRSGLRRLALSAPPTPAHDGGLYVSEGGHPAAPTRIVPDGARQLTVPGGGPPARRGIVRVDPDTWMVHDGLSGPWHRPIDVRFHPGRPELWVVDFGEFEMTGSGARARAGSGSVWRIAVDQEDAR